MQMAAKDYAELTMLYAIIIVTRRPDKNSMWNLRKV